MARRPLALLPAALLALSLSACSSSDDPSSDSADETSSSASEEAGSEEAGSEEAGPEAAGSESTESGSTESPSPESDSAEAEGSEATGEDYRALAQALFEIEPPPGGFRSVEQVNRLADFPEGVSVARLNRDAQRVCIEDTDRDIAITVDAASGGSLGLVRGACVGGDEVAGLVPEGPGQTNVTGDRELAEPLVGYLEDTFGG